MTLEEMNARWEAEHASPPIGDDEEEFPADEDDDDEDWDPEAALNTACDHLHEVMEFMGQYGQKKSTIGKQERKQMLDFAQTIYAFLVEIGELDEEGE